MKRKVRPNVVSGGTAINLGNNLYYMRGKTHKQGGIDIGSNPKTGIEVENGEVVQTSPKGLRVFSAQPILNGISPANALLMGGNPNNIFNAQETWKQANHYNDDGTKFEGGGYTPSKEIIDYIKKTEGFRDKWYKDGNGIDTIGYGFTGDNVKKLFADGITREQADKYFLETLNRRAKILEKDTPNWDKLTQSQKDSLLSYAYNIGPGSYKRSKKLQEALLNEDWDNVANNISIGYNDKRNPGLRKRRDYERELFKRDIKSSSMGDEEKAFRTWYDRYSRSQNLDPNPDSKEHFYDYRTYWKNRTEQQKNDEWKLGNHLPDTYKMPGHPTFSIESIYSTRKTPGGTWKQVGIGPVYDEQFVDSKYTRGLKTYQNVSFALGGDKETINIPNVQYRKLEKRWKKLVNSVAEKIGVSEKDVENYFNSGRLNPAIGAYYSIENSGRVRRNDSPTANESEKFNDRVNKTIYGNVKKTSAIPQTGKPNMKYGIPYLIDKEIKIDGVGRMPTNALDSLAKYASITGISLQEALGLAGQETKGGANPYGNTNGTKEENRALLNGNYFREFGFIPAEYLVRDFEYNREGHSVDRNIPPLQHAFQYYKAGKYNSNDKSHSADVLNTGRIMLNDKDVRDWINSSEYTKNLRISKKYGGIHIKPSKRGTFTAAAKRHHMSVQEFARTVLNNRARYSAAMVKKANFARNASKWHKKELGGDMTKQYYITRDNIYSLGGNVRRKAFLGAEEYERFIDADGKMKYRIGNSVYSKDGFSRATGMSLDEIDSYFDAIDNEGRGEVSPSILRNYRTVGYNRALQRTVPFIDSLNGITYLGEQKPEIEPSIITGERKSTVAQSSTNTSTNTNSKQSKAKSFKSETNVEPSIVEAYRTPKQGVRQNTIGFDSSLAGVSYYGPNRDSELPEQQTYTPQTQGTRLQINTSGRPTTDVLGITPLRPYNGQQIDSTNRTRLPINTSGRPTVRAIGFAQLRPYDGRPIETPTSGTQSSSTGGQRRNSNRPTTSSAPTAPVIPVDYDAIDTQINNENNRILTQSLNNDILTPITGRQLSPIVSTNPQGLAGGTSVRTVPNNPYYSRLNVGLHKIGNYIKNNPDLIGLGVNLTGNLAASLINRSAIKGMRYGDAPIPISAQKLPTEVNIEPQVSSIRENVAGQERLIADNTADSRVALARRQRVRNQGVQQYQTLFGNKLNTELQLLTADRLNRQGVDAQNVTQYNRWRGGLYDFENRRREMLAENAVAGINNAAEAIAGERGYLARREARKQDARNRALIALTSPNAQKVFDANPGLYEELIRKMSKYGGNFNLLTKRLKK